MAQAALNAIPSEIHCALDYETLAPRFLSEPVLAHLVGGSGQDVTAQANLDAFADLAITPRLLRDVSRGHTRCEVGGVSRAHPIFLAPVAFQQLFHPDGERATAQAAGATGSCLIASTLSSLTLEDIAKAAGPDRWFQLYFQPDKTATLDLVRRAETAGYLGLVVTLDTPIQMPSLAALRAGFRASDQEAANLRPYPPVAAPTLPAGESRILQGIMSLAPRKADLEWLVAQTALPVWVKGVLHPQDAEVLLECGVDGLIVSNHGGRGLDGAPASLDVLPLIRDAVGEHFPLLFDGGIRSGTDVFKAIALGADAVLVGRLQAFALSVAGALGVAHMIKLLREELELCMALSGCATLADIRQADL